TTITETQSRSNDAIQKPARSRRGAEAAEPQPEEKPAKRASRSTAKSKDPDIYYGVITVPLNFPAPVSNDETRGKTGGRRNSSRDENTYDGDDVTTVALPRTTPQAQQSDRKRVYAPRTVTITRARPSSESTQTQTAEKRASQSNAQSRKKN
ncbi:MAG: hypothetical protein K2L54_01765, partial [Clostridiales bacterium]|nr:hypothetical protein [Clostridiales bacterium]